MKVFMVEKTDTPKFIPCEYCEGTGYREFEFYEEFLKEDTKMTYLCPACGGSKSVETEEKDSNYEITEIEIDGTQTIKDKEFYLQSIDQNEFYYMSKTFKLALGEDYYSLIEKEKEGVDYYLFDSEKVAKEFIEKEKITP